MKKVNNYSVKYGMIKPKYSKHCGFLDKSTKLCYTVMVSINKKRHAFCRTIMR